MFGVSCGGGGGGRLVVGVPEVAQQRALVAEVAPARAAHEHAARVHHHVAAQTCARAHPRTLLFNSSLVTIAKILLLFFN